MQPLIRPLDELVQERIAQLKKENSWRLVASKRLELETRVCQLEETHRCLEEERLQLRVLVRRLFRLRSLNMEQILAEKLHLPPEQVQAYKDRFG